jgi:hypothetical protein
MVMLRTYDLDMAPSVDAGDIDTFLIYAAWAIHSTYHTVLKASPGAAIFGRDMLFNFSSLLTGTKLGTTGNARQLSTLSMQTRHAKTGIINSVIKYCLT